MIIPDENRQIIRNLVLSQPVVKVEQEEKYWYPLIPYNNYEKYLRALYTPTTIQMPYERSTKLFRAIRSLKWDTKEELHDILKNVNVGLHRRLTKCIWDIREVNFDHSDFFTKKKSESWQDFRARIHKNIFGLGVAKAAFLIELLYPLEGECACFDVHMKRAFGLGGAIAFSKKAYLEVEQIFVAACKERNSPVPLMRHIIWDGIKKIENSNDWAKVFKDEEIYQGINTEAGAEEDTAGEDPEEVSAVLFA